MPFSAMDHPNRVGITAPSSDSSNRVATTAFVAANIAADFTWTTYTPVYGAQTNSSTIFQTAAFGRYTKVGTTVHYQATVTSTNIGTATGYATITMPFTETGAFEHVAYGRENVATGKSLNGIGLGSGLTAVLFSDGTSPVANGNNLTISGTFQST